MNVFVLQHVHTFNEDDECVKLIGVYSTEERAKEAIQRLLAQPGFRDEPIRFSIDPYEIDVDHWAEGYVTVDEFWPAVVERLVTPPS